MKQEQKQTLLELLATLKKINDEVAALRDAPDDNDDVLDMEILVSMQKDYDEFFKWALDISQDADVSKQEGKNRWERLHPDLPLPRVFRFKRQIPNTVFTLFFFLDAFPLFVAYKS